MNSKQDKPMQRRVVITGMGVVSAIGVGRDAFCEGLKKGVSGLASIQSCDTSKLSCKQAFEVKDFNSRIYGTHLLDPFIQYAVTATHEAIECANFVIEGVDPNRVGLSISSSKGGVRTIDRFRDRFQKHRSAIMGARLYTNAVPNFAAQWVARRIKIKGPAKCYVAACATGTVAVVEGFRMVAGGEADYCLAGASDASLTPLMISGYQKMKALSKEAIRPFDQRRDGFLIGEGAGILFLETLESARARGAKIYGEILEAAYGQNASDAIHFDLKEHALSYTLKTLLARARILPEEIDYINLHGTGTRHGDYYETMEIKEALGKKAYEIPMSSIKSMTGHMLGASGTVEIIASCLAMEKGFIPPTLGLEKKDKTCDLDYTPLKARPHNLSTCLSISMGFGGHVAVIALRKDIDS